MSLASRYCQICDTKQTINPDQGLTRCHKCGGLDFNTKPRPHVSKRGWDITPADVIILRRQGIDPEAFPEEDGA